MTVLQLVSLIESVFCEKGKKTFRSRSSSQLLFISQTIHDIEKGSFYFSDECFFLFRLERECFVFIIFHYYYWGFF